MDQKKTGMIEFQAFVDAMTRKVKTNVHPFDLEKAFRV
jgi:Ca2+-binding EF-hand superfamily protein